MKPDRFILLLIAFAFTMPAAADAGLIKRGGVKLALTSAGQNYELFAVPGSETDRRFGYGVGLYLEWFDMPVFSVITQAEYAQRGMRQVVNITDDDGNIIGTATINNRLDYLSFPLLAKLRIGPSGFAPYALGGVRWDYLLGYRSDGGLFNPVYDDFDNMVMGGTVGAGFETDALGLNLLAEIRYNFDLNDSYRTELLRVRNDAYDLWVGVSF